MMKLIFSVILLFGLLAMPAAFGQSSGRTSQSAASADAVLSVSGEVARPLKLNAGDLAKLPRHTVSTKDHDRKIAQFEGVTLMEVLRLSGVEFAEKMRGRQLALFLVVDAADGYRAVFALPELDPAFTDQIIILADRRDGKALPEAEGPWRMVLPNEKRQARWVRKVVALTIRRA